MSTAILFASKTGTTEDCASRIKSAMTHQDVDIVNLGKNSKVDLSKYETVVIGTPLYMGQIRPPVKQFIMNNHTELLTKNLHFFVCGMARGEEGINLFLKQIPATLFNHAIQVKQLGGDVHLERLGFFYKFIMKKILSESKPELGLLSQEITEFSRNID